MTARVLIGSAILALTACGARLPAVRSIAPPVVTTAAPVAPVPDTTPVAVAPVFRTPCMRFSALLTREMRLSFSFSFSRRSWATCSWVNAVLI